MNEEALKNLVRPPAAEPAEVPAPVYRNGGEDRPKQKKREKYDVHGWIILDKPVGMTSTHAVSVMKRLCKAKRAGHAGTLDPLASGALPIALGEATKTVPFVMDGRKLYRFTVRWGEERDTDDAEGRVIARSDDRPSADAVRSLARDLGRALGCFGHVSALRRAAVGSFDEKTMILLEQLEALCHRAASGEASLADALMPVETALDDIPALAVSGADAARLQRGQAVLLRGRDAPNFRGTVYVTVSGRLLALAELDRGEIVPKRVFNLAGLLGRAVRKKG